MPIGETPHRRIRHSPGFEGLVENFWPLRVGDRVMFPDYVDEAPRLLQREDNPTRCRPAYQDPPIIGTVLAMVGPQRHTARCEFPGVGVRDIGIEMLTRCEL